MTDLTRWKWWLALVLGVVGLALILVYPPSQTLKPGADLGGGHTLIYQVDVPADARDSRELIDQTIEVLKQRVDPTGVMNLAWRRLAGNRFEVQMPAAGRNVKERRGAYLEARERLLSLNLSRGLVEGALRLEPDQRAARLEQLAGGDEAVARLLGALAEAADAQAAAQQRQEQAEREHDAAQKRLEGLGPGPAAADVEKAKADEAASLKVLIDQTSVLLEARARLAAAWDDLLASNVSEAALEVALSQSDKPGPPTGGSGPAPSPRQLQVSRLCEQHPGRAHAIGAVAAAYAAYEEVKGPLDDPNDLIALLRGSGVLEFRIAPSPETLPNAAEYRQRLREKGPRGEPNVPYRWFVIDEGASFAETATAQEQMRRSPADFLARRGLIGEEFGGKPYLLLSNQRDSTITQADTWQLAAAYGTSDERGLPAVGFELNAPGAQLMGKLTAEHQGQPMAIVLDGRVMSAPNIRSTITRSGIITGGAGGFGQREFDYLKRTLNAGSLQARVSDEPIYQRSFDAAFGRDNLERGLRACLWSLAAVGGFMAAYYLFNGLIADFALLSNLVLIMGIMSTRFLSATFTLPGIAGIVLTIGMAVDANVLILERIREELERGTTPGPAVRTGYAKAMTAIIDSNLTTLITCVVLGYTATADVKGFAVTLGIGILATMFTAVVGTRPLMELSVHRAGPRALSMLPMLVPAIRRLLSPNIDWVGLRPVFLTASGAVIAVGLAAIYYRGQDMLDVEFRSGTQVSFNLAEGRTLDIREVKERLSARAERTGMTELSGDRAKVMLLGKSEGTLGTAFSVSTLEQNRDDRVSRAIKEAFQDVLDTKLAITFAGSDVEEVSHAPVQPVREVALGSSIERPEATADVGEFIGGVAIVLDDMQPPATVEDLTQRIRSMRLQPPHHEHGYRRWRVVGLDLAAAEAGEQAGTTRYRSAAVVSRDDSTNYLEDPEAFTERGGLADTEWRLVRDALTRESSLQSVSSFSPQVSHTMQVSAVAAIVLSLLVLIAYIWFRFGSLRYGLGAIIALVHDVAVAMGLLAIAGLIADSPLGRLLLLSDFKTDLAIVAAILTLIGYSLNDTIVVFDRIRENRGRLAVATPGIINDSINQTMSRTVLTNCTTLLALIVLYLVGGDGVHGFAFTMLVGAVVGTYSSIAIAAPILLIGAGPKK